MAAFAAFPGVDGRRAGPAPPPKPKPAVAFDGLRLHLSSKNSTGYLGVTPVSGSERFQAQLRENGKRVYFGTYDTAVEAAAAYARQVRSLEMPKPAETVAQRLGVVSAAGSTRPPEESAVLEEFDGVRLYLSSNSSTGYRGVRLEGTRFRATYNAEQNRVHLGQFGTAVEGAVAYARHMQSLGEAPPLPPLPPPLRVLPEVTQVELQLHLSATNPTGYKGVYVKRGTGRFEAKVCSHGQLHHIGNFDTALQAAEAYARHVQSLESA